MMCKQLNAFLHFCTYFQLLEGWHTNGVASSVLMTTTEWRLLRPEEGQCEMQGECMMHHLQAVPSCIYPASYRDEEGMRMWGLWEWVSLVTPGCHMPHQSGHNKELGVVQLSIYYLHIYISTHWAQSWGLAWTIFYESLQKYVTSNNDIPISNVCSSDKLIELCRYKCV